MKVRNIIGGQILETVSPNTLAIDCWRRMELKRIHSLLVFNGNKFEGILTMTDIASGVMRVSRAATASTLMTPVNKCLFVNSDDPVQKCKDIMLAKKIHHLVVKDNEQVIGVVSSIDLMQMDDEIMQEAERKARNLPPG